MFYLSGSEILAQSFRENIAGRMVEFEEEEHTAENTWESHCSGPTTILMSLRYCRMNDNDGYLSTFGDHIPDLPRLKLV